MTNYPNNRSKQSLYQRARLAEIQRDELLAALEAMHKHFITEAFHIGETEELLERASMMAIANAKD